LVDLTGFVFEASSKPMVSLLSLSSNTSTGAPGLLEFRFEV
jgi:hypothetical protein